ncbi:MAG: alginate lyase family protein [Flavobacteriaceae bacterium]|nr:alginate lyase family protein [Flavobacteriaceae bacterium]
MSIREVLFFRIPQQIQYKLLGKKQRLKKFKNSEVSLNNSFNSPVYQNIKYLNLLSPDDLNLFTFFESTVNLSEEIDWLKDHKNKISSQPSYYANINRQNFEKIGDVKYVAELSRLYFLPFLALDDLKNQSAKQLAVIENCLQSWSVQNPYLKTIHWTSGIEVGIRSINLIYTHIVLKQSHNLTSRIDNLIKTLILKNYHFLKNHLSLYSSANNHLVAELAGLVVISHYFENKELIKSRSKWRNKLYNEIRAQIKDDGVNMELCTHYHAEVADHFLNAIVFIKNSNLEVPDSIETHFSKMSQFISHVTYNGNKTIYGDYDEGFLIYPYHDQSFNIYKSLEQSFHHAFDSNIISQTTKPSFDYRNYLIFGDAFKAHEQKEFIKDMVFVNSGYAFFYDHETKTKVSFDFGELGDQLSAAHGHSDMLHFTLENKGIPILIDAGTYQYHTKYNDWRSYFRSIAAHNTISINGLDHAKQNSRMSWLGCPKITLEDVSIKDSFSKIKASHEAFKAQNIRHTRTISFDKVSKIIEIEDQLITINKNNKPYTFEFFLNFDAMLEIKHVEDSLFIEYDTVKLRMKNKWFSNGKLLMANNDSFNGWHSLKFDQKHPSKYFILSNELREDLKMKTVIELDYK